MLTSTVFLVIGYRTIACIFLIERPAFKPVFKAIIVLLEACNNENEFHERYKKVTVGLLNNEAAESNY